MSEYLHPTRRQVGECEFLHRVVCDVCEGMVDTLRETGLSDLMARALVVTVLRETARSVSDAADDAQVPAGEPVH